MINPFELTSLFDPFSFHSPEFENNPTFRRSQICYNENHVNLRKEMKENVITYAFPPA